MPGFDVAAARKVQVINHRLTPLRNGDKASAGGLFQPRYIQCHTHHDAGAYPGNAVNFGDAPRQAQRCAFELGEDIRETVVLIVPGLRGAHRVVGTAHQYKGGHATHDNQCGGNELTTQMPHVTHQHSVACSHQLRSSGLSLCAFSVTSTICPLLMCTTRSAIPAIAAL